jgi:hypothetical protein
MGIQGVEPVEVYSGTTSKNSRILAMFMQLLKGEIMVHPSCHAAAFIQVSQFNPMRRDNTDGILDLLTYAPKIMELYGHQLISSNIIEAQEFEATEVVEENWAF